MGNDSLNNVGAELSRSFALLACEAGARIAATTTGAVVAMATYGGERGASRFLAIAHTHPLACLEFEAIAAGLVGGIVALTLIRPLRQRLQARMGLPNVSLI